MMSRLSGAASSSSTIDTAELDAAVASWSASNWSDVVQQMNQAVSSSKQHRDQSSAARKILADTTKQFKRSVKVAETAASQLSTQSSEQNVVISAMDALSKECRVIVKAYQEEIDNLTRRCKATEQGYTTVLSTFENTPDPAALLVASRDQWHAQQAHTAQLLATIETVNQELERAQQTNADYKKQIEKGTTASATAASSSLSNKEREELSSLRKEVAEYEIEFRSLKNQDITIRKLEDKIYELQTAGEESLSRAIDDARQELALTEGRRAREALEREALMEAKVQTLELQLRSERAGREASQHDMLTADNLVSHREAAWEAQRQILVHDNERVREQLQTLKVERDVLASQLETAQGSGVGGSFKPTSAPPSGAGAASMQDLLLERNAYEAEVSELSEMNTLLRDEARMSAERSTEEKREYQAKIDALEREMSSLNNTLASLESQLSAAPSHSMVDNMRRELRILKRLEYNAGEEEADMEIERDPEIVGIDEENDLETVLMAKLRRAEKELIAERNSKTEMVETNATLTKTVAELEQAKEASDNLVASLEKDLERAIATPTSTLAPKRELSSGNRLQPENPEMLEHILDPSLPAPPPPPLPSKSPQLTATEKAEDDHSVATIVMAQRDRLRARCEALEAERDSFKRELQGQVQASESLKADNTKLYEKVRYLQNYANQKGGSGKAYQRTSGGVDRDLDLEALEQRYEASVDPFKQFNKSERQRKLGEMSPMERTVFVVAKTVLSTKEMRTGLFFYVVALHLLVFVTTYNWSHAGGCESFYHDNEHLSHLPPGVQAQMTQQMAQKSAELTPKNLRGSN